jgi:hypothetical protein
MNEAIKAPDIISRKESPALTHRKALTRQELADALQVSVTTVIRLERQGTFCPSGQNQKGWGVYDEHRIPELRELMKKRPKKSKMRPVAKPSLSSGPFQSYNADVAARVFEELDQKTHPADIVKKLIIHPEVVEAIHETWVRLRGGLYISQGVLRKIEALPYLEGEYPVKTAEQFFENMKETLAYALPCVQCKKKPRKVCVTCAAGGE